MKFRVTYYSSESGWVSDQKDYGIVEASSRSEACDMVALREIPHDKILAAGFGGGYSWRESFRNHLEASSVYGAQSMTLVEIATETAKTAVRQLRQIHNDYLATHPDFAAEGFTPYETTEVDESDPSVIALRRCYLDILSNKGITSV